PHLLRHFMARFCAEENRALIGIAGEAMALLSHLDWPGNVRQLENAVYRAVVMSENGAELGLSDFPQATIQTQMQLPAAEPLVLAPQQSAPLVSGIEIPIAPSSGMGRTNARGTLAMLTEDDEIRPLEAMEAEIIRFAISHYRGQMSEVARRLKIGRSTLYRKIEDYAVEADTTKS
ncbi:MAG TPA: helix-turn-helix domain-containing protein, partial [Nitrosospira sp.]